MEQTIEIGQTGLKTLPLGLGAWQWGDRLFWDYGKSHTDADIQAAFQTSVAAGVTFFDTAEVYGQGRSEKLLGQYLRELPGGGAGMLTATKFFPFPWRLTQMQFFQALQNSLKRLEMQQVDLYQIHWSLPPVPVETRAKALAQAVERGMARAVGVSNYNSDQMRRSYQTLKQHGVLLASNQVEYSLLNRQVEFNGLLDLCKQLNVTLIAYSPLAKGLLSGKYTPDNPPPGMRGRMNSLAYLGQIQPLLAAMRSMGKAHGDKTPAQVALNWAICKGTLVIPGAKNARQAQDNAGALGWRLDDSEVAELDRLSQAVAKS